MSDELLRGVENLSNILDDADHEAFENKLQAIEENSILYARLIKEGIKASSELRFAIDKNRSVYDVELVMPESESLKKSH